MPCGEEFGYIVTKKEYENYYLRAEFKWGEETYEPRKDKARDSGILSMSTVKTRSGRLRSSFSSSREARVTFCSWMDLRSP